jgi:CPA1 family monovalent cation:H+ antiporter
VVLGGIAYGVAVAFVVGRVRKYVRDPAIQILITLITPFLAYIPAEQLNVSGVLATVVTGIYLGTRADGMLQPASRVSGMMFWRTLIFLLESALFVLLGLELRAVVSDLSNVVSVSRLAWAAAAVVGAIIGIRLVWELAVSPLIRFLPGKHSLFVVNPWRYRLVIGWGGMRGAISLAIALTLPAMENGQPFRQRSVLILLAAVVVVVTLLGDGDDPADTSGFRHELVVAQRDKLAELYAKGKISDDIRRTLSRALDLQEPRTLGGEAGFGSGT